MTTKSAQFFQLISTEPTFLFNNKIKILIAKNVIDAKNLQYSEVKVTIYQKKIRALSWYHHKTTKGFVLIAVVAKSADFIVKES